MTEAERAVLAAIGVYAQRVRDYNSIVDRPGFCHFQSREYIEAANAMEAAHDAVMAAADVFHGAALETGAMSEGR